MMEHGRALEGLKVADFSWTAAGPISTRMLADHGAFVVRVESGVHLDSVRITGPFRDDKPGVNKSGFYADFNSSKYSLALNLKRPEAHEIAKRLIMWADVVAESFTPRVMAGWGLSYDDIVKWKPEIIMISSCMQGQTGPYRFYSGYGGQGAALAGIHYLTGWPDLSPSGPKGAYTDATAPRYAVAAILAALEYRERTGHGQYIDLSQVEAAIDGFMSVEVLDFTVNGRVAERRGNRSGVAAPHGAFPCRGEDQWITIAVESDEQWRALLRAMANPAWADSRFDSLVNRLSHQDELETKIAAWTRDRDPFKTVELLQRYGVAAGVVQKAADLFDDPQLAHREHFRPLDHAEMGRASYNGPAHLLSESPAVLRSPAPLLGEHTRQILKETLGYSDQEIDAFAAQELLQ